MFALKPHHQFPQPEFLGTEADARRLSQRILILFGILIAIAAAAVANLLPPWIISLTVPVVVVRWILLMHDLFHLRNASQVNFLIRLMPILLSPLSLGYREYQEIHGLHHRFMATPKDPEFYQIQGNKLWGFLNAMTSPEQAYIRWLGRHRVTGRFLAHSLFSLVLFGTIAVLAGWGFLWYWIPLRITYGVGYFVFFYCVHRRGKEFGVYSLHFPPLVERVMVWIFGREAVCEICYHPAHHAYPRVAPQYLPLIGK